MRKHHGCTSVVPVRKLNFLGYWKTGREREKERVCIFSCLNLAIFPFQFYLTSFSGLGSPSPFPSQRGWPQCPYTSTVPRGGCSSTLPTPNCPALPKQTDFQPSITSAGSDTEEALPASVDPHSQARLGAGRKKQAQCVCIKVNNKKKTD